MKSITYQINDRNGIHARPAGILVQCAKRFVSEVTMEKNGRSVSCKKLFAVMQLGVKYQDVITISAEGEDEEEAVRCIGDAMRDAGL
ncbi:MAG: HPr family phosphocarrier protein [Eubacteriales bacterium]